MLTVRNLDERVKAQLRIRAAQDGCSMEEEARRILRAALLPPSSEKGIGTRLHERIKAVSGGVEFEPPSRSLPRPAPDFGDDDT